MLKIKSKLNYFESVPFFCHEEKAWKDEAKENLIVEKIHIKKQQSTLKWDNQKNCFRAYQETARDYPSACKSEKIYFDKRAPKHSAGER